MPLALEQFDLRGYDLVISSEAGPAKGVITPPLAAHLCYCHSPMRYIWNMYHDYKQQAGFVTRAAMIPLTHYMRAWDTVSATRVDRFVANSHTVAARIRRYYGRVATVVPPPVDVEAFSVAPETERGDYMLMVGELLPYKRPDLAVEACNRIGAKLIVIGGGEMLGRIRKLAGPTVTVMGPRPFEDLLYHYARCRALIFPGEEDFGIVPVEAMASGRPVIAYGGGGATETVIPKLSGILFKEQTIDCLVAALETFREEEFDSTQIAAHADNFSVSRFVSAMNREIEDLLSSKYRAISE
jgi:glycosyltransferase involved in cell wall biosynthesis